MVWVIRCRLTEDELEDIVEDEIGVALLKQLEGLRVVHGPLLLVDLGREPRLASAQGDIEERHAPRAGP